MFIHSQFNSVLCYFCKINCFVLNTILFVATALYISLLTRHYSLCLTLNFLKMEQTTYDKIISEIGYYRGLTVNCLKHLKATFPNVPHETLRSIIATDCQNLMKQTYVKSEAMINKYYNMYKESVRNGEVNGIIMRIAADADIAPCLLAKLILSKHLQLLNPELENDINATLTSVNKYMRDSTLIQDKELAHEVFLCCLYDDQYSPMVELMKSSLGQQYEIKLYRQMSQLGIAYRDEEYLRKFGYDKTPDVKLEIPIAIDGFIVHWIESKALFGDYEVHKDYVKNQYSSYWNRFGSGLVIYWFGYLESIISLSDKRFIIKNHLPNNITTIATLIR